MGPRGTAVLPVAGLLIHAMAVPNGGQMYFREMREGENGAGTLIIRRDVWAASNFRRLRALRVKRGSTGARSAIAFGGRAARRMKKDFAFNRIVRRARDAR